jgi:hypothetical protein
MWSYNPPGRGFLALTCDTLLSSQGAGAPEPASRPESGQRSDGTDHDSFGQIARDWPESVHSSPGPQL